MKHIESFLIPTIIGDAYAIGRDHVSAHIELFAVTKGITLDPLASVLGAVGGAFQFPIHLAALISDINKNGVENIYGDDIAEHRAIRQR